MAPSEAFNQDATPVDLSQGTVPAGQENVGAASQDVPYVTFETGRHYQVHKTYIWLGPLLGAIALVIVIVLNSIPGLLELARAISNGELQVNALMAVGIFIGALVVLYGILLAVYALAYKNMSYVFDEREFSFYSGIITKRRVHVPYARVQSVNHRASIFQRLAGVCTVSIDSAGGSSNKAVRVPYLQLGVAERLRVDLFVRKAAVAAGFESQLVYRPEFDSASAEGVQREEALVAAQRSAAPEAPRQLTGAAPAAPAAIAGVPGATGEASNALDSVAAGLGEFRGAWGGAIAGMEPVTYEKGLSNRELLFTSFSHSTPWGVAIAIGLTMLVTVASVSFADDEFSRMVTMASLPIVIASFVLSFLLGVAGVAISYGNFKVRRRGSRIEVERGLLQRSFSGIDVERIQTVEIRQSFIRRLIGYCELSLGRINANSGDSSNQNSNQEARGLVIHPFVKIDEVNAIIDSLAPEFGDRPHVEELNKLGPGPILRRAILRRGMWFNWGFWTAIATGIGWGVTLHIVKTSYSGLPAPRMATALAHVNTAFGVVMALCVIAIAVGVVHAVLWARGSGYAWNQRYVALRNDGLSTSYVAIPRSKVQSGNTRSNPFQRAKNLATIVAVTAAGTHATSASLIDLPVDKAEAFIDWLKPRH